jgi:hypothetical protein
MARGRPAGPGGDASPAMAWPDLAPGTPALTPALCPHVASARGLRWQ